MPLCRHCSRQLLLERRVALSAMVSLDELRQELPPHQTDQLLENLLKSVQPMTAKRAGTELEEAFATCIALLAVRGELALYVADDARAYGYQIRPEVINGDCCSWSIWEAAEKRRFNTKQSQMLHRSLEIRLDGQPIYVQVSDVKKLCKLRPPAAHRLEEIAAAVTSSANDKGVRLTRNEQVAHMRRYPDVRGASDKQILDVVKKLKPASWSKPGRRAGEKS
jgi:hypothetical protein